MAEGERYCRACARAAMSPQQLMYTGREHEPLPLLLSFSHGDSEMRGERV
jgi:hypothetical protein